MSWSYSWRPGAHAVVVVGWAGKLLFTYSVNSPIGKESFDPYGIATDSQMILTADSSKHRIHILDQDGQFLHHIDDCDLNYQWGLCTNKKDNLFVAENRTSKLRLSNIARYWNVINLKEMSKLIILTGQKLTVNMQYVARSNVAYEMLWSW